MHNVIITGANGFIGSSLINKLIKRNVNIVAISRNFDNNRLPENEHIVKICSDISDVGLLLNQIPKNRYDALYHLAWRGVSGDDKADPLVQLDNEKTAIRCAKLAKELNVEKFLMAGTIAERSVESLPMIKHASAAMMYGAAKYSLHILLDIYCKRIEQKYIWMQFSNIYGVNDKTGNLISYTIQKLEDNQEAAFGPADQPYDFIYIDDLLEAIIRIGDMDVRKSSYFIGSGTPAILKDYLYEIAEIYGKKSLIKIGEREDDGIRYSFDMFDISDLRKEIGEYVSDGFKGHIKYTKDHYGTV